LALSGIAASHDDFFSSVHFSKAVLAEQATQEISKKEVIS
jgi:hypothetical protein